MLIHISVKRLKAIQNQGHKLSSSIPVVSRDDVDVHAGTNEYHILATDQAVCGICGTSQQSVEAWTPVELEYAKIKLKRSDV
jgi:hypothetical protein